MTLKATIELVPNSRTSKKGALWACSCSDGFSGQVRVTSRTGASHELARLLVQAGYPDGKMEIWWKGKLAMTVKSLHWWARRTVAENMTETIHTKKYVEQPWRRTHD